MKKIVITVVAALALAPPAGAFPEAPSDHWEKRQTGCAGALENAILGTGGAHASPIALANGTAVYFGICVP